MTAVHEMYSGPSLPLAEAEFIENSPEFDQALGDYFERRNHGDTLQTAIVPISGLGEEEIAYNSEAVVENRDIILYSRIERRDPHDEVSGVRKMIFDRFSNSFSPNGVHIPFAQDPSFFIIS
jgi:hypothetical protein